MAVPGGIIDQLGVGSSLTRFDDEHIGVGSRNEMFDGDLNALLVIVDGRGGDDYIKGGSGCYDLLAGGAGNDVVQGDRGGDAIHGGHGRDQLLGGAGNDAIAAGAGGDFVNGELGNDTISGGKGSDRLWGGGGSDVIRGGGGNDAIFGASHKSLPSLPKITVNYNGLTGTSIGSMKKGGHAGALATNDISSDFLYGGGGKDTLKGGAGADLLDGGAGKDVLKGGTGADAFLFKDHLGSGNVDKIVDFKVGVDTILLDHSVFTAVGPPGELALAAFHVGTHAGDSQVRIIYNDATGALSYDKDGSGGADQVKFAKLEKGLHLSDHDFLIV